MTKTIRDHIAEACRAQRVHETAKLGVLDTRVAQMLPVDYRYADRILNIRGVQTGGIYQMALYCLIKRLGGEVQIQRVEYDGLSGDFAWRFDKEQTLEIKAIDHARPSN